VEVTGYPELAQRYHVSSVPKTVVGETHEFVGAGPESMLLKHVQDAAAEPPGEAGGPDAPSGLIA
jgi:predicted DsbA family dithiol-disulfide isomerase